MRVQIREFTTDHDRRRFNLFLLAMLSVAMVATTLTAFPAPVAAAGDVIEEDLVFYDDLIGRGVTREATTHGALGGSWLDATTWRASWSVVLPVDVNGNDIDELFFYDRSSGTAKIHDVTRNGMLGRAFWQTSSWRRTWHTIIAVDVDRDGSDELFLYDRVNGAAKVHDLNANGTLGRELYHADDWRSWDMAEALDANGNGEDELVLYSRDRQELSIFDITSAGRIGRRLYNSIGFVGSLVSLEAVRLKGDGKQDLLLYTEAGRASVWDVANDARNLTRLSNMRLRATWQSVTPVDVDGDGTDELFFYEPTAMYAKVHNLSANGRLGRQLSETEGIEQNFHTISSIRIDPGHASPSVYETKHGLRSPTQPALNGWRSDRYIHVQWALRNGQVPDDHGIHYYELAIDGTTHGRYGPDSYAQPGGPDGQRHRVDGLEPNTVYSIAVTAVDHDGNRTLATRTITTLPPQADGSGGDSGGGGGDGGDGSKPIWVGPAGDGLPYIEVEQLIHPNNAIDIGWCCSLDYDNLDNGSGPATYDVYVSEDGSPGQTVRREVTATRTSGELRVTDLDFNTPYTIRIVATGVNGVRSDALQRTGIEVSDSTDSTGNPDRGDGTPVADPDPEREQPTGDPNGEDPPSAGDPWNCAVGNFEIESTSNSITTWWSHAHARVDHYDAWVVDPETGRTVGSRQELNVAIATFDGLRADYDYRVLVVARDRDDRYLGRCVQEETTRPRPAQSGGGSGDDGDEPLNDMADGFNDCMSHYINYYEGRDTRSRGELTIDQATEYADFLCTHALLYADPELSTGGGMSLRELLDHQLHYGSHAEDVVQNTINLWDLTWNEGSYWYEACQTSLNAPTNDGYDYCSPNARAAAGSLLLGVGPGLASGVGLSALAKAGGQAVCLAAVDEHDADAAWVCELIHLLPG